jgi:hypothetical protein
VTGYRVPGGYWDDAEDYPADDWCYDQMTGATTLTYWEWVAGQRTKERNQP